MTIQPRYFELFFLAWSIYSSCQKSALDEAPFKLFWTLAMILAIFAFWKSYEIFWLQNMGHRGIKKGKISFFCGFNEWETGVYFDPLFVLFKILLGALTYSALRDIWRRSSTRFWLNRACCDSRHGIQDGHLHWKYISLSIFHSN